MAQNSKSASLRTLALLLMVATTAVAEEPSMIVRLNLFEHKGNAVAIEAVAKKNNACVSSKENSILLEFDKIAVTMERILKDMDRAEQAKNGGKVEEFPSRLTVGEASGYRLPGEKDDLMKALDKDVRPILENIRAKLESTASWSDCVFDFHGKATRLAQWVEGCFKNRKTGFFTLYKNLQEQMSDKFAGIGNRMPERLPRLTLRIEFTNLGPEYTPYEFNFENVHINVGRILDSATNVTGFHQVTYKDELGVATAQNYGADWPMTTAKIELGGGDLTLTETMSEEKARQVWQNLNPDVRNIYPSVYLWGSDVVSIALRSEKAFLIHGKRLFI